MRFRCRDFLVTADGLVFSVTEYLHPKGRVFGMLRFVRFKGKYEKLGTTRTFNKGSSKGGFAPRFTRGSSPLKKLGTTIDSYNYLKKHHPEYLFPIDEDGTLLQAVPKNKIVKVIRPDEFLRKLKPADAFKKKILDLTQILSEKSGVSLKKFGVSGSVLVNAHNKNSDIDVVVHGLKNFSKVRACMQELFSKGIIENLGTTTAFFPHLGEVRKKPWGKTENLGTTWRELYEKRLPHKELSFKEFVWHAERKNNVGLFNGTKFDLLCTRDWGEISGKYDESSFKKLGTTLIKAIVTDDSLSFDYPARFKIKSASNVKEIVSYTHTYTGQARKGELIEARGMLEKVESKKGSHLRLLIGSTREAEGEYIKVLQ